MQCRAVTLQKRPSDGCFMRTATGEADQDLFSGIKGNVSFRSSCPEVFCKKDVLRNFAKLTGKHLRESFFFNKVTGLFL